MAARAFGMSPDVAANPLGHPVRSSRDPGGGSPRVSGALPSSQVSRSPTASRHPGLEEMPMQGFPVVAMVCSAGGLEALSRVLGALDSGFGAAVLVLQHQDPEAPSLLADILGRRTGMPVRTAEDGAALAPGHVLVAPSGRHTLITGGERIALIVSGTRPPYRPSADLLLTSLALAVGSRAIAVVLSGTGVDGATGATAVHHFGGQVLASDEASSAHFSMPHATMTRDSILTAAAPVDELAALLTALVDSPTLT